MFIRSATPASAETSATHSTMVKRPGQPQKCAGWFVQATISGRLIDETGEVSVQDIEHRDLYSLSRPRGRLQIDIFGLGGSINLACSRLVLILLSLIHI